MDEGGALTTTQIDDLVMLVRYGSWRGLQAYVEAEDSPQLNSRRLSSSSTSQR
jgi:hypothetical protein